MCLNGSERLRDRPVVPNWSGSECTVGHPVGGPGVNQSRQPARLNVRQGCVNDAGGARLSLFHVSSSEEGAHACGTHGSAHMAATDCRQSMAVN